jgi:hypothetical protein
MQKIVKHFFQLKVTQDLLIEEAIVKAEDLGGNAIVGLKLVVTTLDPVKIKNDQVSIFAGIVPKS